MKFTSIGVAATLLAATMATGSATANDTVLGATPTGILVWIADELGYFDDIEGGVEVREFESGTHSAAALAAGEIQFSTSSEFAFGSYYLQDRDLRVVAALSASRTCRLFARADSGIQTIADLSGMRVGVTYRSIGQYFLGQALVLSQVDPATVEIVDLSPSELVSAIDEGTIDAAITWEPSVYRAQIALGDEYVDVPGNDGRFYYFLLVGRVDWLSANLDVSTEIVAALKRAEEFAIDNPDAARDIYQARFGLDDDYMRHLWPQHTLRVSLPQDLLFVIEEGINWRMIEGLTDIGEVPNVIEAIFIAPLEAVSAADVGIIR